MKKRVANTSYRYAFYEISKERKMKMKEKISVILAWKLVSLFICIEICSSDLKSGEEDSLTKSRVSRASTNIGGNISFSQRLFELKQKREEAFREEQKKRERLFREAEQEKRRQDIKKLMWDALTNPPSVSIPEFVLRLCDLYDKLQGVCENEEELHSFLSFEPPCDSCAYYFNDNIKKEEECMTCQLKKASSPLFEVIKKNKGLSPWFFDLLLKKSDSACGEEAIDNFALLWEEQGLEKKGIRRIFSLLSKGQKILLSEGFLILKKYGLKKRDRDILDFFGIN
jgi:predicted Zn-ribbon and HTH transcriptional regulator